MAAPVMRDDAVALAEEEQHLVVPVVRAERPAMMEHDGLRVFRTPVLVEDPGAVLHCNRRHGFFAFLRFSDGKTGLSHPDGE